VAHEKLMHLIVVNRNLTYYSHEHPTQNPDGSFSLDLTLPADGQYVAFADFVPKGNLQQAVAVPLPIGPTDMLHEPTLTPDLQLDQRVGDVNVTMTTPDQLVAGRADVISFRLTDAAGAPVTDLQPYLGAMGHLVGINQHVDTYVHVHPSKDKTDFIATFPTQGLYKLWAEFQRNGQIIRASYVVSVQ
jgi:hypothetical protein